MLKKVVVVGCLIIVSQFLFSQEPESKIPRKALYGFSLGLHYSTFGIEEKRGQLLKNENEDAIGGRMGLAADYELNKQINFVPKLEVAFYGNKPTYQSAVGEEDYELSNIALETKAHFTFDLYNRVSKPYLLLGISYSHVLDEEDGAQSPSGSFFSIDGGVGYYKKGKFFISSPELRYSYGLTNINNTKEVNSNILLHSIALVFSFKG